MRAMTNKFIVVQAVRMPKEWDETLTKIASQEYLTKSDIIRRAIKEYLDRQDKNVSPGRPAVKE